MSIQNVHLFYRRLESDLNLRAEAMSLQQRFPDQEDCINEFIRIAERSGLPFTIEEFMTVMYERAQEMDSNKENS